MNAQDIRKKYQEILQESDQESQEDEWGQFSLQMHQKKKKRILTQSNTISSNKNIPDKVVIGLKEKLAQCLANLSKKDLSIEKLHKQISQYKEDNKLLKKELSGLKSSVQQHEKKVIQQKVAYGTLQKEINNYQDNIRSYTIEKQIMQKQIEHYRQQIDKLKSSIRFNERKFLGVQKEIDKTICIKRDNHRLKEDIKRLHILLNDYSNFKGCLIDKHYLGKPYRQTQNWFSENLIGEVELFLKNHQIGYGNKSFTNNLVKFIQLYTQKVSRKTQQKVKKVCSSRIKDIQRKHNHSFNSQQIQYSTWKKNSKISNTIMGNSRKFNSTLNESKRYTESYIFDKLDKSINNKPNIDRMLCLQILQSFETSITDLLKDKQIRKKKIIKLVSWFVEVLKNIIQKQHNNDKRNEIIHIKE